MATDPVIDALWPGLPYPRGASWNGMGVNFALFSEHAERVELCIFDRTGRLVSRITDLSLDVPTTIAALGSRLYAVNARFATTPTSTTPYWVTQLKG